MNKIFKKLFLTYILIVFICLITLIPLISIDFRNYYEERLSHELLTSGILTRYLLKDDLINKNSADIQKKTTDIGKELNARVTIVNNEGIVLGDSFENPAQMENHKDRPEIEDALSGKVGKSVRYSHTLKQDLMYIAAPVIQNSAVIGVVRFAIPIADVDLKVKHIYKTILFSSLLGAIFALLISVFVTNYFVKPIKLMQTTAQKIAKGDLRQRINIKLNNELGDLADNLNQMAYELENKIYQITKDKKELEAILSSMSEGVIVIGKDESIVLMNDPIIKTLEVRTKDPIGKPYWEVIRNENINSILKETIRNKQSVKRELHLISPADTFFNVQTSVIVNDSNEILGTIAVFYNVTELKNTDKMRKEFTANVSHELKTPLTSIKGFVETLLDGAINDKEKAKEFLNIIKTHSDKLEYLVNDLLELAKIESKGTKIDMSHTNLQDLIKKITDLYKNKLKEKQIILTVNIPNDITTIYIDKDKMEQAFSNLLDNAYKFTPEKGKITISAKDEKGFTKIDFEDTGIGITKDHLPRIFERFYRVDKGRSRDLGGTGLGLSIVKHIIEAHGGKVIAESIFERGSKFSLFIPKHS